LIHFCAVQLNTNFLISCVTGRAQEQTDICGYLKIYLNVVQVLKYNLF